MASQPGTEPTVILVIDKDFYEDEEIRWRIERYKQDNPGYNFEDIVFKKSNDPITSLQDTGGIVKKNSLEVRNTIKAMYHQADSQIIGVWLIGHIRPTIWRDAALWRDLGASGFYPSVYPFVALDQDYYSDFDVEYDGFYEKEGMTTGSEVGGGYDATIWGAVLIPPTKDLDVSAEIPHRSGVQPFTSKELVKNFFDRDHDYRTGSLAVTNTLLYADNFGCSTQRVTELANSQQWQAIVLCPNVHDQLQGFNSAYHVIIHAEASNYDPRQVGFRPLAADTDEEKAEFSEWVKNPPVEHAVLQPVGSETYEFYLVLKERRAAPESIKTAILNKLPPQLCSKAGRSCDVYVGEAGLRESDNDTWDGYWSSYPSQQDNWTALYDQTLRDHEALITYLNTHGSTTSHDFHIDAEKVKNANYHSLIYEIDACNTANYLEEDYLAGTYLFYGGALAVSGYSIPFVELGEEGYSEGQHLARFLQLRDGDSVIDKLFLKNYGNSIYLGDPLLRLRLGPIPRPTSFPDSAAKDAT